MTVEHHPGYGSNKSYSSAFALGIGLNIAFVAVEVFFGFRANSSALLADAGVSLGVVMGGLLIHLTGLLWIDPAMSLVIVFIILWGTWRLLADSIGLALDAVPRHIDIEKVRHFTTRTQEEI